MKVTMLGCGSSAGVPLLGCTCAVCTSGTPQNQRTRVSAFVEAGSTNILIDTSPDLRQQALRNNIKRVDAVLYTHDHADHTHGIDELRSFNHISGNPIPVYANNETMQAIKQRFSYAFQPKPEHVWFRPCLEGHELPDAAVHTFDVMGVPVTLFEQRHGKSKTIGYRIGNFAYSTDTDDLSDEAFETLRGVEVWIVDCLRYTQSYSHSNIERTLGWVERLKPKLAVLTHMAHDFDYEKLLGELPAGVVPGYDGLVMELENPRAKIA